MPVAAIALTLAALAWAPRPANAQITVTPKSATVSVGSWTDTIYTFTVRNGGSASYSGSFSVSCSGLVINCTAYLPYPPNVTLSPGASTTVMARFSVSGKGTASAVNLQVTVSPKPGYSGGDIGTALVSGNPPYVVADAGATNNDNQDAGLCAASCFAATYSQSTVPYYSLGQPRSVTLVYSGDRSSLKPFVYLDASKYSPGVTTPSEYQLQAKVSGSPVTFSNGEQTLRFSGSSSQVRLGGQFDATSYGTGVRPLQITATAIIPGFANEPHVVNTTLITADDRGSAVARGWSIAGLQRVFAQADGTLLITDGAGSAAYFTTGCGTGCYNSPSGDFSKVTSNASGYVRAYPDSSKATFNTTGQLTGVADRFGNTTSFEYDASGRLSKIYDPYRTYNAGANRSYILLTYGTYGISQIQEPGPDGSPIGGRVTSFTVASDSTLRVFKDPDGDSTTFGYDASRRLSTVTDRRGGVTTYNYDANSGKLASVDLPSVALYNGTARPRLGYSPWQSVSVPTGPTVTTPATPVLTANVAGSTTDALGRATSFSTDRWGQPLTITEPLGRTTTITRSGIFPSTVQNPAGGIDSYTYTGALLTSMQLAGQNTVSIRYGGWGQPDSVGGTGWPSTRASLGAGGRVDWVRTGPADSMRVSFTYDSRGRVLSQTDSLGNTTLFHYDAQFGNLDSTLAPGNRYTKVTFDSAGRVKSQQSNGEPARQVTYDAINRVRLVNDGVNASPTTYTYNQLFLTRVQDPKGQVYRLDNNALGWVTRRYDPADTLNRYDSYAYDSAGNVKTWTNRRGQPVNFTYDALNRLTAKSGTNTTADSLAYSGDTLVVAWNAVSRDSVFRSATGWVNAVVTRIGGHRFRRDYKPNTVQQLDSVTVTNDAGITFASRHYGWNRAIGTLDTMFVNGVATRFTHNKGFLPVQTVWPSVTRTQQWTAILRPAQDTFNLSAINDAFFRRYSYDSTFEIRDNAKWESTSLRTKQHTEDGLRRTSGAGSPLYAPSSCPFSAANGYVCPLSVATAFTYDAAGNRTDGTGASYAAGNRIQAFNGYTFASDSDGNVVQKYNTSTGENRTYEWSAEGRLNRVLVNGVERVKFDYDASGQVVRRWTNGTLDRIYLWDQGHLLAELDATATQRVSEYAYLPGVDQPFALVTGATTIAAIRYHVMDEVGNVVGVTNGTAVDQQVTYDDWGVATVSGSTDNRLLFKGLLWEPDAGLYYVRARWYEPQTGRFVSEDPIGLAGGINQYAFGADDPVNNADPSGQFSIIGAIGGAIGGFITGGPIGAIAGGLAGGFGGDVFRGPQQGGSSGSSCSPLSNPLPQPGFCFSPVQPIGRFPSRLPFGQQGRPLGYVFNGQPAFKGCRETINGIIQEGPTRYSVSVKRQGSRRVFGAFATYAGTIINYQPPYAGAVRVTGEVICATGSGFFWAQ